MVSADFERYFMADDIIQNAIIIARPAIIAAIKKLLNVLMH
jgi:hypothetical protein